MKPLIKTLTLLSFLTPSVVFSMGEEREPGSGASRYGHGYHSEYHGYHSEYPGHHSEYPGHHSE